MCIHDCPVPIYQDEGELSRLRDMVKHIKPLRILEIGSLFGGTLWYWMQDAPGSVIVSVDTGVQSLDYRHEQIEFARETLWPIWARSNCVELYQVRHDSTNRTTINEVNHHAPFDFIFIDGGHSYEVAKADFENYWPMLRPGGIIAMHDIAYPDDNPIGYGVPLVWREVRQRGNWNEIIRDENPEGIWGIGVVVKEG